jgi:hypothetical protein
MVSINGMHVPSPLAAIHSCIETALLQPQAEQVKHHIIRMLFSQW